VIITRFATDGSGGHGHHTASAILAEEAFDAAADPTRFPEQLQYVPVWKTRRMFHNSTARFFNPNADLSHLIKLDVGGYNPLLGKNYGEIAAESRSMHKSQGFGSAKQRGEQFEYFKPIKGDTTGLKDIFEGMDFSWKRVKGGEKIGASITKIMKGYNLVNPESSLKDLIFLSPQIRNFSTENISFKSEQLDQIIFACSGLFIEAVSAQPSYAKGDTIKFAITELNRSNMEIKMWPIIDGSESFDLRFRENYLGQQNEEMKPLSKNSPRVLNKIGMTSLPYDGKHWLKNGIHNSLFVPTDYLTRSLPQLKSAINVNIGLNIGYQTFLINKELVSKSVDPEKGELYRPMVITPPVLIHVNEDVVVVNNNEPKQISITLKSGRDSVECILNAQVPEGWTIEYMNPSKTDKSGAKITGIKLGKKGSEQTFQFWVTPTTNAVNGKVEFFANVDGVDYSKDIKEIKYDHIPVQTLFPAADAKLVKLDVVKKSKRIGYIPGAGDGVAVCLSQLGYEVITLTDDLLAKENLSQYDAIISGVRAYNTNEKLPSFKQKLMEYVAAGGNYIVQYNTNSWAGPLNGQLGPYPFKITRDRITDEEATVKFELPNHPVFNSPNKITEKDFEGWIQERSIYHASEWDSNYVAPISMADPNEKENKGALIIAKHGKGNFVYTGLVFFRELPAGVPGAYRLFVNLIELGK
jgi:hypothetical protein